MYLLAQRVFWGFDGLVDLSLGLQSVRGAVTRCFALIDDLSPTVGDSPLLPATNWESESDVATDPITFNDMQQIAVNSRDAA
ncbi:MAG: hypothetical protein WAV54_10005 [Acidimicrobiales bacterium]